VSPKPRQYTQDPGIATRMGVPRYAASGWIRLARLARCACASGGVAPPPPYDLYDASPVVPDRRTGLPHGVAACRARPTACRDGPRGTAI